MTTAVASGADVAPAGEAAKPSSKKKLVVFGLLGAVAVGLGAYFVAHRGLEDTDDAQVDADVVGLSARTGGMIVKVLFEDNQKVTTGTVLAEIDPEPAKARLAQAEANLEGARARRRSPPRRTRRCRRRARPRRTRRPSRRSRRRARARARRVTRSTRHARA